MQQLTNGARLIGRITTTPRSHLDHHGRLRILTLGAFRSQGSHCPSINLPRDLICRPVDRVGVELGLVIGIGVKSTPVVGGGLALAEVVALGLVGVPTNPLPVNLVEIVRLQHGTADDSNPRSWLDLKFNVPKHDVPFGSQ